jgi:hypothetical protein
VRDITNGSGSMIDHLFESPLYRGFALYSVVNRAIARNCPELADPKNQHAAN